MIDRKTPLRNNSPDRMFLEPYAMARHQPCNRERRGDSKPSLPHLEPPTAFGLASS
jgi:hypothetical protein